MAEMYVATRGTDWGHTIRLEETTHDFDGTIHVCVCMYV